MQSSKTQIFFELIRNFLSLLFGALVDITEPEILISELRAKRNFSSISILAAAHDGKGFFSWSSYDNVKIIKSIKKCCDLIPEHLPHYLHASFVEFLLKNIAGHPRAIILSFPAYKFIMRVFLRLELPFFKLLPSMHISIKSPFVNNKKNSSPASSNWHCPCRMNETASGHRSHYTFACKWRDFVMKIIFHRNVSH